MRRTLYISLLLVLYLMFSSRSCDNSAEWEVKKMQMVRDSIAAASGSETPEREQILASEVTALQKLRDFTEYIQILTDTNNSPAFRNQTASLMVSLFREGSSLSLPGVTGTELLEVGALPDNSRGVRLPGGIKFISMGPLESAVKQNDSLYSGLLQMEYAFKGQKHIVKARFYLALENRSFGTEKLRTWKVLLGDIAP